MKLKFKIQQYQTDAVENVVKVFNGQPNKGLAEYVVDKGKTYVKDNGKLTEVKNILVCYVLVILVFLGSNCNLRLMK